MEIHEQLNPKLFNKHENEYFLKPLIRQKLLDIADAFKTDLAEDNLDLHIIDIQLVGSNASYEYTKYSDIDLHLVSNFSLHTCDPALLQIALNAERSNFNSSYNILIKGIPVEVYVEDVNAGTVSNGIYSVKYNKWIKFPVKERFTAKKVNTEPYLSRWKELIYNALSRNNSQEIENILDRVYLMRKNSLASAGRLGMGNIVFKELRNMGLIDQLKDAYVDAQSIELSLEHYNRTH